MSCPQSMFQMREDRDRFHDAITTMYEIADGERGVVANKHHFILPPPKRGC